MRDKYTNDITATYYWPRHLLSRKTVAKVKRMLDEGASWHEIERATGVTSNRIASIKNDPRAWDTVDDPVAIERALSGDASVMPFLTLFERQSVYLALLDRLRREPFDKDYHRAGGNCNGEPYWLSELERLWGVPNRRIRNLIQQRVKRAAA